MSYKNIQQKMRADFDNKEIFETARKYAFDYIDRIDEMDVYPSEDKLSLLNHFDEPLPNEMTSADEVINKLEQYGRPNTIAQIGGAYFGFVNGGAVPAALGVKWLSDVWDQCGGLFVSSPINAKLEDVCEEWLKELFGLPDQTVAGFVSGTSMANLCAIAAARFQILKQMGWDVNEEGLNGAPSVRLIAHRETHASVKKTLTLLGFGKKNIEWVPSDDQGRIRVDLIPELDESCIVMIQAGNVNTGAFDDFNSVCEIADEVGAWVHIDGAFGLWAGATKELAHLTNGMERASSWAVDGHKTLNAPYDSGIVMCKHPDAMISALQATGDYLIYSDQRDPLLYTPEMSKRSRAIELWATMKYLGKDGIDEMVCGFHRHALQFQRGLKELGFEILNDVVFNQVLFRADSDERTKSVIEFVQESRECWVGGTIWDGRSAIRVSVCSWATTEEDVDRALKVFGEAATEELGAE